MIDNVADVRVGAMAAPTVRSAPPTVRVRVSAVSGFVRTRVGRASARSARINSMSITVHYHQSVLWLLFVRH